MAVPRNIASGPLAVRFTHTNLFVLNMGTLTAHALHCSLDRHHRSGLVSPAVTITTSATATATTTATTATTTTTTTTSILQALAPAVLVAQGGRIDAVLVACKGEVAENARSLDRKRPRSQRWGLSGGIRRKIAESFLVLDSFPNYALQPLFL